MPKRSTLDVAKEKECSEECQSNQHANDLISAITLPRTGILDKQLASYFKSRCSNFAKLRDDYGRSLLHMAASCGRRDLTIWLLKTNAENINLTDFESGYTALHRSIVHGFINVAVALIQMNANLNVKDSDGHCPLDLIMYNINMEAIDNKLCDKFPVGYNPNDPAFLKRGDRMYELFTKFYDYKRDILNSVFNKCVTEVYTWGMNSNYTSGFASESGKLHPEFLEFFERKNEMIIEISMQKFHTLFLSLSGKVWSCGIGQGGRLGLSSGVVLIPEQVPLTLPCVSNVFCVSVAAGQDHSIFLCDGNRVFVCGTNTYHQLGISPPPASVTKPVQVNIDNKNEKIMGVAASDLHSVVWTEKIVFTCGLHAGQLGHPDSEEENTIPNFRRVTGLTGFSERIVTVTVSNAATLVATRLYIFVLTHYKCFKIEVKFSFRDIGIHRILLTLPDIRRIKVIGGVLDSEKMRLFSIPPSAQELQVAVLMTDGNLYLWRKSDERLLGCQFLARQKILITDVIINSRGMWVTTRRGEILKVRKLEIINSPVELNDGFTFVQHFTRKSLPRSQDRNVCYAVHTEKAENSFRAIRIFSDPKGDNFAVLQHQSALVPSPEDSSSLLMVSYTPKALVTDLTKFYRETEITDSFHDVIFKVERKTFAAHKYILASSSKRFLKLEANDGVVVIDNMSPEVFETILEFAYTGFLRIRKCQCHTSRHEVLFMKIHEAAESLGIKKLAHFLKTRGGHLVVDRTSDFLVNEEVIILSFNRLKFSSIYDIKLKSQDGAIFHAHKCILVARVEYFKTMLSGYWIESKDSHQSCNIPFSSSVVNGILEYLYTDEISKSGGEKDVQFWSSLLIAADQFILTKLKEFSESALSQYLNVRNVIDLLEFADFVNATLLKRRCFRFIALNLASILYSRYLEKLSDKLLDQLTEYFRSEFRHGGKKSPISLSKKISDIPVYSTACDVDEIFAAEQAYPVDWDIIYDTNDDSDELVSKVEKTKPKTRVKKVRKSVTHKLDSCDDQNSNRMCSPERTVISMEEERLATELKLPEEAWVAVERQVKLVKSRLRVNAAIRECPQLLEQKENYVPIKDTNSSSNTKLLTNSEPDTIPCHQTVPSDSNYSIDINFSQLTPRISQAERKRLRRVSESSKGNSSISSPDNGLRTELMDGCASSSSPPGCWKPLQQTSDSPTSFSSIMASEMKQKTSVIKETRKIVMKSLQTTQTEEQAIQELMAFYNVNGVDDEHITVQRVTHKINVPQWVTK